MSNLEHDYNRGVGRPKKSPEKKRSETIIVRITPEEREMAENRKEEWMSLSDFFRNLLIRGGD